MRGHSTFCPLDCPDMCSLDIEVDGDRVDGVGPGKHNDLTQGFICSKVAGFGGRQHHPDRILTPARRTGPKGSGEYVPISWDEALDEISRRFADIRKTNGGEAILPFHYGGSNGLITDGLLDRLFFARLGASQLDKTICAVPATEIATGMYGKMPGVAFEDYVHAEVIVVWGANPKSSNIHLVPILREARRSGAKVVVIDPRRNFSHQEIDLHLAVLPGQDLPLALGLIAHWRDQGSGKLGLLAEDFLAEHCGGLEPLLAAAEAWPLERAAETAGVPLDTVRELADLYAGANPAVIRCGWGVERNRNGGPAIAAILAMPALLGKFGVRGGGYTLSNNGGARFRDAEVLGEVDWSTRKINMTRLVDELRTHTDPKIEALFVYNANPVATVPDQVRVIEEFEREDLFTVVHDQVWTDTAQLADIVLPATTFLEHHDLRVSYGTYQVGVVDPVVAAQGEARSNSWLFAQLAQRMGFEDAAFEMSESEVAAAARQALGVVPAAKLSENGAGSSLLRFEGGNPVPFVNSPPLTADGKVHLTPTVLGEDPFNWNPPDSHFPLALLTPAGSRRINSTLGELVDSPLKITLHPSDAKERSLKAGDRVEVFNDLATVPCLLEVSERMRPGVASMPKGVWRKNSDNGLTGNALCPDHVQKVGGAACFNDARVEVRARSG